MSLNRIKSLPFGAVNATINETARKQRQLQTGLTNTRSRKDQNMAANALIPSNHIKSIGRGVQS